MIDYELLLAKYIDHVYLINGKSFIAPQFRKGQYVQVVPELVLTDDEWDELKRLQDWKP